MLVEHVLNAMNAETFTPGAGEQHLTGTTLLLPQPRIQDGERRFGNWGTAFLAALADHAHVSAGERGQHV